MGFEKAEIIKSVLEKQADELDARANRARMESYEHAGAEKVLNLLAKEMPSFAAEIEKRIEADTDLTSEQTHKIRVYVKNIIGRFQVMCTDNARNQYNSKLRAEGQIPMLEELARKARGEGEKELAVAKRREELDRENRERQEKDTIERAKKFKEEAKIAKQAEAAAEEEISEKSPSKKPRRKK